MPRSRIESASSASSASENSLRGLRGLARTNSIGTLRWLRAAALAGVAPRRRRHPSARRGRVRAASVFVVGHRGLLRNHLHVVTSWFLVIADDPAIRPLRAEDSARLSPRVTPALQGQALTSFAGTLSSRLQLFLALDDFGREPQIGFAADALEIVHQHRLAVGRRFRDAHVARDDGVVNLRGP